jgi:predicted PhzF superfamily epimerase YddE/YHI9
VITFSVRAFTNELGQGGSSVRVLLFDDDVVPAATERQAIAANAVELATAFVHPDRYRVELHNQKLERRLIGHALLGTAAALASVGESPTHLRLPAGEVPMWQDTDGRQWLRAPAAWSPNDRHRQVTSPAEVEEISSTPADEPVQVWAWLNESAGLVRARQFAPSEGKPEDEACGSACMVLAERLARPLTVHHGRHSIIEVKLADPNIELGGRCVIDAGPC